jgi:hypothetical protein
VVDETMQPEFVGLLLPAESMKTLPESDESPPNATQPQQRSSVVKNDVCADTDWY